MLLYTGGVLYARVEPSTSMPVIASYRVYSAPIGFLSGSRGQPMPPLFGVRFRAF